VDFLQNNPGKPTDPEIKQVFEQFGTRATYEKSSMPAPERSFRLHFEPRHPEFTLPAGTHFKQGGAPVSWDDLFKRAESRTVKPPPAVMVPLADFEMD